MTVGAEGQYMSPCQNSWQLLNPLRRYVDVTFLKMAAELLQVRWNARIRWYDTIYLHALRSWRRAHGTRKWILRNKLKTKPSCSEKYGQGSSVWRESTVERICETRIGFKSWVREWGLWMRRVVSQQRKNFKEVIDAGIDEESWIGKLVYGIPVGQQHENMRGTLLSADRRQLLKLITYLECRLPNKLRLSWICYVI